MSTATRNRTRNAVATNAVNAAGVAAQITSVQAVAHDAGDACALAGFNLCKAEIEAGHAVSAMLRLHKDKLTEAYFRFGYCAAFALSRGDVGAITAAKLDQADWAPTMAKGLLVNWPIMGVHLLAYGQHVCDNGVAPPKEGAKPRDLTLGEFRRDALQQASYKAANAAAHRIVVAELLADMKARAANGDKEAAEILAKKEAKKARKPRATNGAAKGATFTLEKMPKVSGVKDAITVALQLAIAEEQLAKKHANDLPLALKEAIAALAKAARDAFELVKDA